jgi:hypothetical protein
MQLCETIQGTGEGVILEQYRVCDQHTERDEATEERWERAKGVECDIELFEIGTTGKFRGEGIEEVVGDI